MHLRISRLFIDSYDPEAKVRIPENIFRIEINKMHTLFIVIDFLDKRFMFPVFRCTPINKRTFKLLHRNRFGKQVTLEQTRRQSLQYGKLPHILHAFTADTHTAVLGELDHIADQTVIISCLFDILYEHFIDLDLIDIQLL